MNEIIESLQDAIKYNDNQVYIVKYYNIYDDQSEFTFGVTSSRQRAIEFIKEHLKICCGSTSNRYSIESWRVDEFDKGACIESFTKEQNIQWTKELGLYYE